MGMQCTFSYSDLQDSFPTHTEKDEDSDTYTVTCLREDEISGGYWQFNLSVPQAQDNQADKYFCWFDCGSASDMQIAMIKFLIRNRICFQCA